MRQPSEYLKQAGVIAYATFATSGTVSDSHGGETDIAILRSAETIARRSDDGVAVAIVGGCTYRARFVLHVGSVAVCIETGGPAGKSAGRFMSKALRAMDERCEDEPAQIYRPGEAVLMTPANDSDMPITNAAMEEAFHEALRGMSSPATP